MKVFNEQKYEYVGKLGDYHAFKAKGFSDINEEVVLVKQAKVIDSTGGVRFYNCHSEKAQKMSFRLESCAVYKVSKLFRTETEQRVCLTQQPGPVHIPKRSGAEDEASVKTIKLKVSRRKMVRAQD